MGINAIPGCLRAVSLSLHSFVFRRKDTTEAGITDMLNYQLEVLLSGEHPEIDFATGKPFKCKKKATLAKTLLADGFRCAFSAWTGDLKEKVAVHRFSRKYNSNFLCERCLCNKALASANPWDFRRSSSWWHMKTTPLQYLQTHKGSARSPWSKVRGWSPLRNKNDNLHGIWLGFGKDVAASLMLDLASSAQGPDMELNDALFHMWLDFIKFWGERGLNVSSIPIFTQTTLSWKCHADYPVLENKMKASKAKLVFIWAAAKASAEPQVGPDADYIRVRAAMAWSLCNYVQISDRHGLLVSQEAAALLRTRGLQFLDTYQYLATMAYHAGVCRYKYRPKLHYFAHDLDELVVWRENPRRLELNAAEDHIGVVKRVARNCHKRTVSSRVAERRSLFLSARCFAHKVRKRMFVKKVYR